MLKNYADVEIFIAVVLNFINFAPLIQSKKQTQKTIDMKKTLLSALKQGSGILLTLFSLLCSCQVWAADAQGVTLYVKIGSNWSGAAATYCIYYYNESVTPKYEGWVEMSLIEGSGPTDSNAIYGATLPTGAVIANVIFVRTDPSGGCGNWDNKWCQTDNLTYDGTKNLFEVGSDCNKTGSWRSTPYTPPCDDPDVSTTSSPSTTAVSASCAGTYSYGGDYCVPASVGIAYKAAGGEYADHEGTASSGAITASLTGLVPGTTYTYKAYVVLDNNTRIEGSEQTFTTGCPTISIPSDPSTSDVSYCDGSVVAALAVTATSYPDYTMEYQWYSSADKSDDDIISGVTESTYTPSSGTLYYRCKVRTNSACDASAQISAYSGRITFDPEKVSPVITASASSVTNYTPVTLTASKAVIETWALSGSGVNQYLYKKTGTSAIFKGNVGSGSAVTYTIEGTAANGCSGTTTVTVNKNADNCE